MFSFRIFKRLLVLAQLATIIITVYLASQLLDRNFLEQQKLNDDIFNENYWNEMEENEETTDHVFEEIYGSSNEGKSYCTLKPDPVPVILMGLGRSGTSPTWQIIGNLTGQETNSYEYTGSSTKESFAFFDKIGSDDGGTWLLGFMCWLQKHNPNSGIIGFKWKPYPSVFTKASLNALIVIARSIKPRIRIVRLKRNLLDVIISRYKHNNEKVSLSPHCIAGDDKCLQYHLKFGTGIKLPTKGLVKQLEALNNNEHDIDGLLVELDISHILVSYEELYYSNHANEWIKLLTFLEAKYTSINITRENVNRAMRWVPTSVYKHKDKVSNYEEVKLTLNGTQFSHLIH